MRPLRCRRERRGRQEGSYVIEAIRGRPYKLSLSALLQVESHGAPPGTLAGHYKAANRSPAKVLILLLLVVSPVRPFGHSYRDVVHRFLIVARSHTATKQFISGIGHSHQFSLLEAQIQSQKSAGTVLHCIAVVIVCFSESSARGFSPQCDKLFFHLEARWNTICRY